jgi:hypothetical protein
MRMRYPIIGILCVTVIIASHWFAFYRGKKHGEEAYRSFVDAIHTRVGFHDLHSRAAILRVMAKHPDQFSKGEIAGMRLRSEHAFVSCECQFIPYTKETGDEAKAKELQSLLDECRELLATLTE